jgi:carbamate kinase
MKKIVIALGGNAIKQADQEGTYEEQLENVLKTSKEIVKLIKEGFKIVVTHGNGPQAGSLLIQQEAGSKEVPSMNLDAVGAMTQGQIGYMMLQTLTNELKKEGLDNKAVAIVNQVLVDKNDDAFKDLTKPVGPFYNEEQANELKTSKPDWVMKEVKPKTVENRFRRVVASPIPIRNIEEDAIKVMVESGLTVIASGGGGVPVIEDDNGMLKGVAAVIDKDLAGERLATMLNADVYMILTDVKNVFINYAKENQESLETMNLDKLQAYQDAGHFGAGSMGPKVNAAMEFVKNGGNKSIITSLDNAYDALINGSGTQVIK